MSTQATDGHGSSAQALAVVQKPLIDLPVVIKFLLQTVEPDTVEDVIKTIRTNLDFRSINKLQKSSKQKSTMQSPEVLILGTFDRVALAEL